MWHEQKVRVQKALALGRAGFIWPRQIIGSANSCDRDPVHQSHTNTGAAPGCHCSDLCQGPNTPKIRSAGHFLLSRTGDQGVIFSVSLVVMESGEMKVKHSTKSVQVTSISWADLVCLWISLLLLSVLSCVRGAALPPELLLPSPHTGVEGVLLLHFHRLRMGSD